MSPVCMKCKRECRVQKNGVYLVETMPVGDDVRPYRLWVGDSYRCPSCSHVVVVTSRTAIAEHFEEGFDALCEKLQPVTLV